MLRQSGHSLIVRLHASKPQKKIPKASAMRPRMHFYIPFTMNDNAVAVPLTYYLNLNPIFPQNHF